MKVYLLGLNKEDAWSKSLKMRLEVSFFDPSEMDKMTIGGLEQLQEEREVCDYFLYMITPRFNDLDLISQLVDDSNKHPVKTLFCFVESDGDRTFNAHQVKSLKAVGNMIKKNGAVWLEDPEKAILYLNQSTKEREWQ